MIRRHLHLHASTNRCAIGSWEIGGAGRGPTPRPFQGPNLGLALCILSCKTPAREEHFKVNQAGRMQCIKSGS
jgi:hypothetical protein